MKYQIKVSQLHCASCAKKIQDRLGEEKDIQKVSINVATQVISLEGALSEQRLQKIKKLVTQIDPGVKIVEERNGVFFPTKSIVGLVILFTAAFLFSPSWQWKYALLLSVIVGRSIGKKTWDALIKKDFCNEHSLMLLATVGAFYLGESIEGLGIVIFYTVGALIEGYVFDRSQSAILPLIESGQQWVSIRDGEHFKAIRAENVEKNMTFLWTHGERLLIDAKAKKSCFAEMSSVTGEAGIVEIAANDVILSGGINHGETLEVEAVVDFSKGMVATIENALKEATIQQGKTQSYMNKLAKIYTPLVFFLALAVCVVPVLWGGSFSLWLNRALILLIVSCPCALLLSIPLAFCACVGKAAMQGIIIKSSQAIENYGKMDYFLFDKTGTLTDGNYELSHFDIFHETFEQCLAYAYALEQYSRHPIAVAIQKLAKKESISMLEISEWHEEKGRGVSGSFAGEKFYLGNLKYVQEQINEPVKEGGIYLFTSKKIMAFFQFEEKIKEEAKAVIKELKKNHHVVMVTGDSGVNVERCAQILEVDTVHSGLLPLEKQTWVQEYRKKGKVIFVGEGINDAVALKVSDLGVSMGSLGSDIAKDAAQIVLLKDQLTGLLIMRDISSITLRRVWENIAIVAIIKVSIILLAIIGWSNIWEALFADVGMAIMTLLNTLRILTVKLTR